jgi:hypothetical protein
MSMSGRSCVVGETNRHAHRFDGEYNHSVVAHSTSSRTLPWSRSTCVAEHVWSMLAWIRLEWRNW